MKDGQGTLTVEARRYLLDNLLKTQRNVNLLRAVSDLEPIKLISEEEIELIKDTWCDDEENYPHLVTNALGLSIDELDALILNDKK